MAMRTLALTLVSGAALLAAPTKIGFVYVSPVGDAGWTFQHDQGRKEMEKALAGQVTTQVVENVPEGADAERVIRELATDGCKIVFTTSFGYMNPTAKVAASFPNVDFFHATGYKTAKNMGIYNARFYEGRYLSGVIAGKMTKTHVAGYVAAFPIPEVMMGIDAFTRGMRSVDPTGQGPGDLGQLLVRSRQGARGRPDPDLPGRRHGHPPHRLHRRGAGRGRAAQGARTSGPSPTTPT